MFADRFREDSVSGVGGTSRTGNLSNPYAVANDEIGNFFKNNINMDGINMPYLTSNNAAYRKSSLDKVGGFDREFRIGAEERDLNFRLVEAGERLFYDSRIVIDHYNNAGFIQFLRHQFEQGKGSYLLYRNAKRRFGKRPPMIPLHIYFRLMLHPFASRRFFNAILISLLFVLAQVAVFIGYTFQSMKRLESVAALTLIIS